MSDEPLSQETLRVLMASAIAIEGIEQTLRDEWKSLDENERSELMGRVTGVVLFEVVTLGSANAAKAGKFGKLDGLLDGLPLSPATRDRITGHVRDAIARFKGDRRTLYGGARIIEGSYTARQLEATYSWIRGLDAATNTKAVARNTNLPEWYVAKIRQHVFFDRHLLPSINDPSKLVLRRFDAIDEIAIWWKAATEGGIPDAQLGKVHRLFAHEYIEYSLIRSGLPFRNFDEVGEAFGALGAHDLAPLIGNIGVDDVFDALFDVWRHWRR